MFVTDPAELPVQTPDTENLLGGIAYEKIFSPQEIEVLDFIAFTEFHNKHPEIGSDYWVTHYAYRAACAKELVGKCRRLLGLSNDVESLHQDFVEPRTAFAEVQVAGVGIFIVSIEESGEWDNTLRSEIKIIEQRRSTSVEIATQKQNTSGGQLTIPLEFEVDELKPIGALEGWGIRLQYNEPRSSLDDTPYFTTAWAESRWWDGKEYSRVDQLFFPASYILEHGDVIPEEETE